MAGENDVAPHGCRVLITGATSGLGLALCEELAAAGWEVLVHGRDESRTRRLAERLGGRAFVADLASLEEVRGLARAVEDAVGHLDVLVNNAGVGFGEPGAPREVSVDGHELRLAVDYLAPVVLTRELLPLLERSAPARVVQVGSLGQEPVDLDDIEFERDYDGVVAYRRAKLALAAHTLDLAANLHPAVVTVNCVHPASFMPTTMVLRSEVTPRSTVAEGVALIRRWIEDPELAATTGRFVAADGEARPEVHDPAFRAALRVVTEELLAPGRPGGRPAWVHEHTGETSAAPSSVWRVLRDLEAWPRWDTSMQDVHLLDPFGVGARVSMTPVGQEPIESTIVAAVENELYADETAFGGVTLRFSHRLRPRADGGTRVVHRLEITGATADRIAPELGPAITKDFPEAMAGLLAVAEDYGTSASS